MKTPVICLRSLLFALAVGAVTGCNSSSAGSSAPAPDPITYQPAPEIPQLPPAPGEPAAASLPLPEPKLDFTPSANLADMIKLARAGVSESLMLKFIQNASGSFGLGAQGIIYLNDLGVSETVINTMMERDRGYANAAPSAVVATAAPVVVEPPPVVVAEPAPVTVNYFYETLTPYGSWIEVDGYGRCWQPTVVVYQNDWQPYCDRGRWVYTDCGWYWASDYSWGNVAFHYGRWFNHPRRGWCWTPDTVWAPAWVSWRRNDNYCGWAPLPPAARYRPGLGFFYQDRAVSIGFEFGLRADNYTFVSRNHFTDSHPRQFAAPRHEVTQIFNTTIVNNHYSGGGRNERVFNHGIAPAVITAGTANQIRPVRAPVAAAPGVRPDPDHFSVGAHDRGNFSTRNSNPAPTPTAVRPATTPSAPTAMPQANRDSSADRGKGNDRRRDNNSSRDRESSFRSPAATTPTIVGPAVTRPAPIERQNGNANDNNRNSVFRPSSLQQTPAPRVTPPAPAPTITGPSAPATLDQNHGRSSQHNNFSPAARSLSPEVTRSPEPSIPVRPAPTTVMPQQRSEYQAPAAVRTPPPSFTPRSAPVMPATPAPSTPRVDSRPAPSATASSAPARSGNRSGSDRDNHDR